MVYRPDNHFPSAPRRLATHILRFDRGDSLAIQGFCTAAAAASFLDLVLNDNEYRWTNRQSIYVPSLDLKVSSDKLEEIVEEEGRISMPSPYPTYASMINGAIVQATRPEPTPSHKEPRAPKAQKAPRPEGLTSIGEIAAQLGMEASEARSILRKKQVEKPAHGWSWADPAPIIKLLK